MHRCLFSSPRFIYVKQINISLPHAKWRSQSMFCNEYDNVKEPSSRQHHSLIRFRIQDSSNFTSMEHLSYAHRDAQKWTKNPSQLFWAIPRTHSYANRRNIYQSIRNHPPTVRLKYSYSSCFERISSPVSVSKFFVFPVVPPGRDDTRRVLGARCRQPASSNGRETALFTVFPSLFPFASIRSSTSMHL